MNNLKVSHLAWVVKDLKKYLENSVFDDNREIKYYEIRDADICFIKTSNVDIEIIEPKSEKSKTFNFLQKTGGGFHHICYEIANVAEAEKLIKEKHMIKLADPTSAPELNNQKVMFAYTKNNEIIEFALNN